MAENNPENADSGEVELVIVTMSFDAADMGSLVAILSKYIVLTRMEQGCRNVDMIVSDTRPNRILIIEKWDSPATQQATLAAPLWWKWRNPAQAF